jgi:hypothetical protein
MMLYAYDMQKATPLEQAKQIYVAAKAAATAGTLFDTHVQAMATMWSAEEGGASILVEGNEQMAKGCWTSMHSMLASMSSAWGRDAGAAGGKMPFDD